MNINRIKTNDEIELINIFKNLIKIDTTNPPGNEIKGIRYIKSLLDKEKIENKIITSGKNRANLYAKIQGEKNNKPITLLSHIDVVKAEADKWKLPPFEAIEENGYIYGRGALDTKDLTAIQIMIMILIKRNNIELDRDVILIVSADEENGSTYGMEYLKNKHSELIEEGIVISEGGGFIVEEEGKLYRTITSGEKGSCVIKILAKGKTGHPSSPPEKQALIKMSKALEKITNYTIENNKSSIQKRFNELTGNHYEDKTLKDLYEYISSNSITINKFEIGNSVNVIPSKAECEIEIRFLPNLKKKDIFEITENILMDLDIEYEIVSYSDGYMSSINNNFLKIIEEKTNQYDKKSKLLPIIALGRTDGRFMKGDIYGITPIMSEMPFSEVLKKVHNIDECISVESLIFGFKVLYESIIEINNRG